MTLYDDGFGNRLQQNAVKGTVPTQSVLADMNTNRLQNWSYDANGNAVNIPGVGSLTYDISNRVKTAGGETYEYAPDNKRIWKNDTYFLWSGGMRIGSFTLTQATNFSGDPNQVGEDPPGGVGSFNPKYRLIFGQVTADYYFGGRKLKQMDRLGSQGGSNYYPYGEERTVTANPADKFATYHRDGTGLDYADQRYYASGSGRFVSVDPAPADNAIVLTGNWNRYSYVDGDPANKTNPRGLCSPQDSPPCFSATGYGTPPGGFGGGSGGPRGPEVASFEALPFDPSLQAAPAPTLDEMLASLRILAEEILKNNQRCLEIFNKDDSDWVTRRNQILDFFSVKTPVGSVTSRPLVASPGTIRIAQVDVIISETGEVSESIINISLNNSGQQGTFFASSTTDRMRIRTLLHEIGHIFNKRSDLYGGSAIEADSNDVAASERNDFVISARCNLWN